MKTTKARRKGSSPSYAKLKTRLDKIFSLWTRVRFSKSLDCGLIPRVECVCCGVRKPIPEMQAGHFVSRSYLLTRWHPENVAPQCMQCNVFKKGNLAAYAAWGVNKYGMDWPARMVALSRVPTKYSRSQLQDMITDYEQRLARLTGDERE